MKVQTRAANRPDRASLTLPDGTTAALSSRPLEYGYVPSILPKWAPRAGQQNRGRVSTGALQESALATTDDDDLLADSGVRVGRDYRPTSPTALSSRTADVIGQWDGIVTKISEHTFTATVSDLLHAGADEIAEFSRDDVSPDDMDLMREGALFYWQIYRERSERRRRYSEIRLRRLQPTIDTEADALWVADVSRLFFDTGESEPTEG